MPLIRAMKCSNGSMSYRCLIISKLYATPQSFPISFLFVLNPFDITSVEQQQNQMEELGDLTEFFGDYLAATPKYIK